MSVDLVIAHFDESLDWIKDVDKTKYRPIVVSKTIRNASIYQPYNKGYEASAFLEYIIRHYNNLPEFVVFVHAHEFAWHQHGSIQNIINSFVFDDTTPHYYNFNKEILNVFKVNGLIVQSLNIFEPIAKILGFNASATPTFISSRCAQFIVHRSLIHRHPIDTYKQLLNVIYNWQGNTKQLAINFEWIWSFIFTGEYDEQKWIDMHVKDYLPYIKGHGTNISDTFADDSYVKIIGYVYNYYNPQ